jgi:hypothetical protein
MKEWFELVFMRSFILEHFLDVIQMVNAGFVYGGQSVGSFGVQVYLGRDECGIK